MDGTPKHPRLSGGVFGTSAMHPAMYAVGASPTPLMFNTILGQNGKDSQASGQLTALEPEELSASALSASESTPSTPPITDASLRAAAPAHAESVERISGRATAATSVECFDRPSSTPGGAAAAAAAAGGGAAAYPADSVERLSNSRPSAGQDRFPQWTGQNERVTQETPQDHRVSKGAKSEWWDVFVPGEVFGCCAPRRSKK